MKLSHQGMRGHRPFTSVWEASTLLDCTEHDIYHYIEEGQLPLAFDLSDRGERSFVRIAAASVTSLQNKRPPSAALEPFLTGAVPETQVSFRAPQLARMWQCDQDHIYHLIKSGALEDIGGPTRYRVPRDSVIRFLKERMIQ